MNTIFVCVYSPAPIAIAGLGSVLAGMDGFEMETAPSLEALRSQLAMRAANILLLETTGGLTLDGIRNLGSVAPKAKIILWVDGASMEFLSQAVAAGVAGVLGKNSSLEQHAECLRVIAAGYPWIERDLKSRLLSSERISLTPRERQIMGLLAQGRRNKEIAFSLGITEGTVKVYLSHLYAKIGAGDRFELALIALRNIAVSAPDKPGLENGASPNEPAIPFPIPGFVTRPRIGVR
ncbi:MAG TPA: response regulator transcription factor [Bryobacteraceae bacterium]|nr:response regulator transcription factor [Bryobacteraceae bacterium]